LRSRGGGDTLVTMNDDNEFEPLEAQIDALPYGTRARAVIGKMRDAAQQDTPGVELGELYVQLVSIYFADLPIAQWPLVHGGLVEELSRDPDFPEEEIWIAVEARYE